MLKNQLIVIIFDGEIDGTCDVMTQWRRSIGHHYVHSEMGGDVATNFVNLYLIF